MLKRTLLFTSPVNLSLKNAQLVVSYKDTPDEKRTIPIEDIGYVIIDNPMVSMTKPLINVLTITDKQYADIINIWGSVEKKKSENPMQLEIF